jgi:oligopeptide/dipeptide ABC transporter ATP-binding protein
MTAVLTVEDLTVTVPQGGTVVDRVGFTLGAGETLGLVGESGSGKSMTALAALGLAAEAEVSGRVVFEGRDLLTLGRKELQRTRGARIAMIFQEPGSALDPVFTAGSQIAEVLRAHTLPGQARLSRTQAKRRAVELLAELGLPEPERVARAYPHELSGGMQQRVLIAMATCCRPSVLLADEPTTALDVTIQAQILSLLGELQQGSGMGMVLISHDLGIVAGQSDRVLVMYAGRIVEEGPTAALFARPRHPYTLELLRSRPGSQPRLQIATERVHREPVGDPRAVSGCRFRARCPLAREACSTSTPALVEVDAELGSASGHRTACLFPEEVEAP